jgi:hypothetical protein
MRAALGRLAAVMMLLGLFGGLEGRAGSIVIGNLSQSKDQTSSVVSALGGSYSKAVGFTMGADAYELDSVTVRLLEQAGSQSTLSIHLYGGTPTDPSGPALVDFDAPAIPMIVGNVTFTPTSSFVLQARTTYWLDLTGTSNVLGGIAWYASNPGILPTGVATSDGARFTNQGSALTELASSTVLNSYQINGTVVPVGVPEPPAVIPAATAILVGLVYAGRRRLRSWWRRGSARS